MASGGKKRQSERERRQKMIAKIVSAVILALLLLSAFISIREENGGAMPTLEQMLDWFGLYDSGAATPIGSSTKIHFIDVGQGDSVLIEQDGAFALIDAGERDAAESLVAYLQSAGVDRLSMIVMTHPHSDHIGSMRQVLENFPVDQIILPDFNKAPLPTSSTFTKLMTAIRDRKIEAVTARVGNVFTLGTGTLTVLSTGIETDNLNNISLTTLYESGGLRFFASGDAEKEVERDLLASGADVHANIYKAAHHGSSTSNTEDLLEAVRPNIIVISCGKDNSYGHPHREAMETFSASGAEIYRTDLNGSIIAYADETGKVQVHVSKQEAA